MDELIRNIAFSQLRGVNIGTARELMHRCGNTEGFFNASASTLLAHGINDTIADPDYRQSLLSLARLEAEFVCDSRVSPLFFNQSEFPQRLATCDDAPCMLYVLGKADLNCSRSIAIVGTRHATAMGVAFTKSLVKNIKEKIGDVTIVSGLAYGIDITAHRAALEAGLPTVAVVAHGLKTIYPADHRSDAKRIIKENGALVTEYTSDARPNKGSFLARNRIIASLADATVVIESDFRGGAMSTARMAAAYGRDVFAMPGYPQSQYSHGCNRLIANNTAILLTEAEQIAEALGWPVISNSPVQPGLFQAIDPRQRSIIDFLRQHPDATVNDLAVGLALPFATLSAMLFEMEMADLITTLPGGRYGIIGNI